MSNNRIEAAKEYNPTQTDINRAKERQFVVDHEKGPENKKRKRVD
jgi:hypothetical protein